jgi:Mechanosensitive ion channel, conserved TM helix
MIANLLQKLAGQFVGLIPNVIAAVALIVLGWVVGWFLKRVVIQICLAFAVHRYLPRRKWSEALTKADVRYTVYNFLGNIVFVMIFLIFLYSALVNLRLTVLSDILQAGLFFLPRLIGCLALFGVGYFVAARIGIATQAALLREAIPRALLIGRFARAAASLFFGAMALDVLNVAHEIVFVGFVISFLTLAVIAVLAVALGGHNMLTKIFQPPDEKQ